MRELTNTRMNNLVDPILHIWGWEIPVYLFLGGLVAGMMIISGYYMLKKDVNDRPALSRAMPVMSFFFLSLGMFALFLDLEHKLYVWRLYTTFKITSPMSWGAWILVLVYPALAAAFISRPGDFFLAVFPGLRILSERAALIKNFNKITAYANIYLGFLLGMYTGILLSTLGARPLWNTPLLWLLFLVSGLSSAAALMHLLMKEQNEAERLMKVDTGLIIGELLILALIIIGFLNSSAAHISAIKLLISGPYASFFWVFVVGIGMLLPLFIQLMKIKGKIPHSPAAPLLVITGGVMLRFLIVFAGQFSHWIPNIN